MLVAAVFSFLNHFGVCIMKALLISAFVLLLFLPTVFPQTAVDKITVFNQNDLGGTYVVNIAFTLDSASTGLVSSEFSFPRYDGVNFNTYPITVKHKFTSTYGTPNVDVFLQATFNGNTDTVSVDTIAINSQSESDSISYLRLRGSNGLGFTRGASYKIFIRPRSGSGDINAGTITLVIPRLETNGYQKTIMDLIKYDSYSILNRDLLKKDIIKRKLIF
jgi:hypothetical protein